MLVIFYCYLICYVVFRGENMPNAFQDWVSELPHNVQVEIHKACWLQISQTTQDEMFRGLLRWLRRSVYKVNSLAQVLDVPFDATPGYFVGSVLPVPVLEDQVYADHYRDAMTKGNMPRAKEDVCADLHKDLETNWAVMLNQYLLSSLPAVRELPVNTVDAFRVVSAVIGRHHPNILVRNWWSDYSANLCTVTCLQPVDLDALYKAL